MIPFVHLHVHSCYSQLDGMSSIEGLINKAIRCKMKALALTDHGSMFGIKAFSDYVFKTNKKLPECQRIKPILGTEAYVSHRSLSDKTQKEDLSGWHLIILAKNKHGYQNLCKLISTAWTDGFYSRPRIDKKCLVQYKEGLIITSACLGGEIPQTILSGNIQEAEKTIIWFKYHFGEDFYLELQRHLIKDEENINQTVYDKQVIVNHKLLELAKKTNTDIICTNDVHFVEEEHAEAHDRLICIGTGKELDDLKRLHYTKQEWFKTVEEMNAIFFDLPDSLKNTIKIADKIELYSIDTDVVMPMYSIPKEFFAWKNYQKKYPEQALKEEFNQADKMRFSKLGGYEKVIKIKQEADYLEQITLEKAKIRYGNNITNEIQERLRFELETIKMMGFPGYFLIVHDFIQAARQMGVSVGPGRGSVAGSLVAYCLKITDIDPLKYDLLFERFLNPDRISMPDIDIDFDNDGRSDIVRWVINKYGERKVAHIVTYGTMATKSSIRDVGRVQGLPISETDRLTKLIPDRLMNEKTGKILKISIKNCIKYIPEFRKERYSKNKKLADTLKYAEMLEGTIRQMGIHACGIIIGSDDLTNFVPLATAKEKGSKRNVLITQYEGAAIESVGLIKMDFLGLKTLSIIKDTVLNVKKSKNKEIDITNISQNDSKTYELYGTGQTIGIFQFESTGMQKYLQDLRPTQFEDLIAMNALYRPGPMTYIPDFIARKHGKTKIQYDFPEMATRLKDTYGITVYQEQVMLLSRDLAGFTQGQSDELREAMGKKLKDKMEKLHDKFIEGATVNHFGPKEKLEKIWSDWVKFAEYAFNKSHATCYSWISYQTAYLKAHYPAEFLASNLTNNRENIGEITKFMDECRKRGIKVLGPDINESDLNFTVNKKGDIRFGLGGVKGLGHSVVEEIVENRSKNGIFRTIFDFIERINLAICNKKNIEILSLSGSFDSFPEMKREHFFATNTKGETFIETILRYGSKYQSDKKSSFSSLFNSLNPIEITKPKIPVVVEWNDLERLNKEKELIGIYLSSHPLDKYYVILRCICNLQLVNFNQAKSDRIGQELIFGGIIINYKERQMKNTQLYGILEIEDYSGNKEIPLFWKEYVKYKKYCCLGKILIIKGKFPSKNTKFRISSMQFLQEAEDSIVKKITIYLFLNKLKESMIDSLFHATENMKKGNTFLHFQIENQILEKKNSLFLTVGRKKYQIDKSFLNYLESNHIIFKIN